MFKQHFSILTDLPKVLVHALVDWLSILICSSARCVDPGAADVIGLFEDVDREQLRESVQMTCRAQPSRPCTNHAHLHFTTHDKPRFVPSVLIAATLHVGEQ